MIVVGGGIIGLSCAWRLAQQGVTVTVFDAGELAGEASWAGAGMLAPGGEITEDCALARMCLASMAQYDDFVLELQDASGVSIDYQRCGAIEVAFNDAEARELEQRSASLARIGIASEPVPFGGSAAACFFPGDAVVNPRDITAALRIACGRLGVTFREHERVLAVFENGPGVRTGQREYRDDAVLIAAGAWSSALSPLVPEITPVRGHLIGYSAREGRLPSILRNKHTYMLQRRGGLIIAGSSTEHVGFARELDERITDDIHARAAALLPDLAEMKPLERWNGFRPGIAGDVPFAGKFAGTEIFAATGHYRNGILLAPETARVVIGKFLYNKG